MISLDVFYLIVILQYYYLAIGVTRNDLFNETQNGLAKSFKVLGHPARIAILQHIIKSKSCICGDLVDQLGLAQATISQHLKELKNAEIIKGDIEGVRVCYCINEEKWSELKSLFNGFLDSHQSCGTDCC